jgi:1,5-anhydro-D-fructose reductase (1,5-anhydro-D-mannitol-forming)
VWNFNAPVSADSIVFTGSDGEIATAVRADEDVIVTRGGQPNLHRFRNPPHVHQPLIQTIVDELRGKGKCESTGESAARSSWVMERCLEGYYAGGI